MQEQYHRWFSPRLQSDIEVLVFGHAGYPVVLFPPSMGRYFEAKDFGLIESVSWFVDQGLIRIYCPDGVDSRSWYNRGIHPADRLRTQVQYDSMIKDELFPLVRQQSGIDRVCTAGCSFGSYQATNFSFRHPELVRYVFNMGGVFDIRSMLDGYYSEDVYFNNPPDFIPQAQSPSFTDLFVVLGTGTHDMCWDANEQMAKILRGKGIQHWLDVRENRPHDWSAWREMFPHYLSLIHA